MTIFIMIKNDWNCFDSNKEMFIRFFFKKMSLILVPKNHPLCDITNTATRSSKQIFCLFNICSVISSGSNFTASAVSSLGFIWTAPQVLHSQRWKWLQTKGWKSLWPGCFSLSSCTLLKPCPEQEKCVPWEGIHLLKGGVCNICYF